ncbi:MAG: tellurium resistance protein TerC [Planctomycetota bacterium]
MLDHLFTLLMLIVLQAVLGFDNLLYISLESKRAPEEDRARIRRLGIGIAIGLRIVLLFVLIKLIEVAQSELFAVHWTGVFEGAFNAHSLIVLFGGAFILYTATKEVLHMIALEEVDHAESKKAASSKKIIALIVLMNLVFSFDSILSAMALTDNFVVMSLAIVASGVLMIVLADRVSEFLARNRMYEVLGLFILFIVGVMLVTEGGHLAHIKLAGNEITPMTKTTFYFVIAVLVLTDIVQSRYQKKLLQARKLAMKEGL